MKEIGLFVAGALSVAVVGYFTLLSRQHDVDLLVANAQGKVDAMQFFCKEKLEVTGLIKKEKDKNAK